MSNDKPLNRRSFMTIAGAVGVSAIAGCSESSTPSTSTSESTTDTTSQTTSTAQSTTTATETPTTTTTETTTEQQATPNGDPTKDVDANDYNHLINNREKYTGAEINATVEFVQSWSQYAGCNLVLDNKYNSSEDLPLALDIDADLSQGDKIKFVGTIQKFISPNSYDDYLPVVKVTSYERV